MIRWNVSDVSMPTPSSHIQHPACKRHKAGQGKILKANQKPQRTRREQMQEVGDAWWKTGKQTKTGSKTRHFQHKTEINWTGTGTNGVLTVKNVPIIWSDTCYRHSWSIWCLHRRKNKNLFYVIWNNPKSVHSVVKISLHPNHMKTCSQWLFGILKSCG